MSPKVEGHISFWGFLCTWKSKNAHTQMHVVMSPLWKVHLVETRRTFLWHKAVKPKASIEPCLPLGNTKLERWRSTLRLRDANERPIIVGRSQKRRSWGRSPLIYPAVSSSSKTKPGLWHFHTLVFGFIWYMCNAIKILTFEKSEWSISSDLHLFALCSLPVFRDWLYCTL